MQRADELHHHSRMTGENDGKAVGPTRPMSWDSHAVGTPEAKTFKGKKQSCADADREGTDSGRSGAPLTSTATSPGRGWQRTLLLL